MLEKIMTLAEAAEELGVAPVTLRAQAARGVLAARQLGKTWLTTATAVAAYRRDHMGRPGRPSADHPRVDAPPFDETLATSDDIVLGRLSRRLEAIAEDLEQEPIASTDVLRSYAARIRRIAADPTGPGHTKWSEVKRMKSAPPADG